MKRLRARSARLSASPDLNKLEALERRLFFAAAPAPVPLAPPVPLLDPTTVPQFASDITQINPFSEAFKYAPDGPGHYTVGAYAVTQDLGLGIDPATGQPYQTKLFAYGPSAASATYPGRTLEVQKGAPIAVTWVNGLPTQHVVNVDPTLLHGSMGSLTYVPATNEIGEGIPMVPHLHGGHTDAIYDGTPLQWWTAGGATGMDYTNTEDANPSQPANTFTYRNDQESGNLWYHDHAIGVTRLNAYAGMAGFYIIRDAYDTGRADNPLGLPAGPYEMGLAIQDKQFLSNGQLWAPANAQTWMGANNVASTLPEMFGDVVLVNGKAWPKMSVEARRYRFRLVNASDSRFYTMSLTSPGRKQPAMPIWQIGTDLGLMNAAVQVPQLTLAPGERVDLILDFTNFAPGTRFILRNSAETPFPAGAKVVPGLTDRIMAFDVVAATGADATTPPAQLTNLRPGNPIPAAAVVAPTRQVALYETLDKYGRITPLMGTPASSAEFMDPITENIAYNPAGTTEVWQIYNNTADTHPIHLHQVHYQVLTRQAFRTKLINLGASPSGDTTMWGMDPAATRVVGSLAVTTGADAGWKDTIQINPGEVITLRATFDLPGRYVTHCHILSHEEHDMMRYMQVGDAAFPTPSLVVRQDGSVIDPTAPAVLAAGVPETQVSADAGTAVVTAATAAPLSDRAALPQSVTLSADAAAAAATWPGVPAVPKARSPFSSAPLWGEAGEDEEAWSLLEKLLP